MIEDAIKYVKFFFDETKQQFIQIDDVILKSALVYQYLYHKHFNVKISISNILHTHRDIGLIGPGNGCLTHFLETIFSPLHIMHSHSILHDAFGRFYNRYSLDRGYTYVIPKKVTPRWIKRSPLCGQISGLIYCISKRIIV